VKQDWKGFGSYGTVGLEVVLSVLVGFFGGYWLDGKLDTRPWLTLLGFAYGVAAAARALYRAARRATKEAEDLDRREREERRRYGDRKNGT
jgi:F0F1-type ATP synthase assembly protein I